MTVRTHFYFWAGTFAAFLLFVWLFKGVLLPFVLGAAIAYLLEPLVERLARWKVSRLWAALLILGLFFLFVLGVIAALVPLIYRELLQLADSAPAIAERIMAWAAPYMGWMTERFGNGDLASYQETLKDNAAKILEGGAGFLAGGSAAIATGGQALVGFVSVLVLTPVTAFFMMKEWQTMTDWIDRLLPRKYYATVTMLMGRINAKLSGFVRGQVTVAFALAVIYALALTIAGLKYGFLIGLMAGVLSLIPMVGSTTGLVVAVVVAWFQSGEWLYTGIIAGIFLVGQFVEGNFLTPRLFGKKRRLASAVDFICSSGRWSLVRDRWYVAGCSGRCGYRCFAGLCDRNL